MISSIKRRNVAQRFSWERKGEGSFRGSKEGEKGGDGWVRGDDETMVYNLFLHRNHHDKCWSMDNGVRQKRRYEHRRTKRRNSELRDWIFFSPRLIVIVPRGPLHCRARDENVS